MKLKVAAKIAKLILTPAPAKLVELSKPYFHIIKPPPPIHVCLKDLEGSFRYPLAREGVYAPGGSAFLAHTKQRVGNIVGLTALLLAFFLGYE